MFRSKGHLILQEQEVVRDKLSVIYELLQIEKLDIDGVREMFLSIYPGEESLCDDLIDEALNS